MYDLTVKAAIDDNETVLPVDDLHSLLRPLCKKWTFQLERGEQLTEKNPKGYLHYQCRISLVKKKTQDSLKALLLDAGLKGFNLSTSSTNSLVGDAFYCMKADTKVDGPWTDKDHVVRNKHTKQLELCPFYLPWQQSLLDQVKDFDMRSIHIVICTPGEEGKSMFCEKIEYDKLGYEMPPYRLFDDIMAFAFGIADQKLYVFDMPRAMKKDKMSDFFSGMEALKNGRLFDKRYCAKSRRIDRPNIILFTNTEPSLAYLSMDRWRWHTIKNGELVKYVLGSQPAAAKAAKAKKSSKKDTSTVSDDPGDQTGDDDVDPDYDV